MAKPELGPYRSKRNPARTPEPFGGGRTARPRTPTHAFVVHQHAARRMHWDLRLEVAGALASFAVPRGPSLDPRERRLAVRTEDHPLEYVHFEGVIPPGNYGAGAMIVWDCGVYETADGTPPADGLARGKLDLVLQGHKLGGRWALVRTKGGDGQSWLLFRKRDGAATGRELVAAEPASVLSGLTVDELGRGVDRSEALVAVARAAGARRRTFEPSALRPMLATPRPRAFAADGWLFELKYDGARVLVARARDGRVRLFSRRGRDTTALFPEIARAVARLPAAAFVLDGEIVALDAHGVSSFARLQQRLVLADRAAIARAEIEVPLVAFAFDLLSVCGHDLRPLPLDTRKVLLRMLVPRLGVVRFADHVERDGTALLAAAEAHGLEGVVAKRAASPYQAGRRTRDWLKVKAVRSADLAIVGYARGRQAPADLGSLLLAWRQDGTLRYAGRVGSGFDAATRRNLLARLAPAERATPAFAGAAPPALRGCAFVEPALVAEVRYAEVTSQGVLRHPVFIRLREDKSVAECDPPVAHGAAGDASVVPAAAAADPAAASGRRRAAHASPPEEVALTHRDKVFFPAEGYTKGDLLRYYAAIWPWLEPYLRERPVVLTRYPDGIDGKHFFQKNAPPFTPAWVDTCRVEDTDYFVCNDRRALLYVVNSGAIPLHVWSARRGSLERPDWAILDLDPKGAPFRHVVAVARHIHALLDALGAPHFVKTSGQDGLHVLLPLGATLDHAEARLLAEALARLVAAERPDIATVARPRGARAGKVYLDYLQNGFGKLIAAPFSVRPRAGAPVSTPLSWSQVGPRLDPAHLTVTTVPRRMRRHGDPMRDVLETTVDLQALLAALRTRVG